MKQIFLPVWADSRYYGAIRLVWDKRKNTDEPEHWWGEAPVRWGHTLISYVHWKKPFAFPKEAYVFGDSGGFSLRNPRQAFSIDPVDVLHWQRSMCSVGAILDLPPFGQPSSTPEFTTGQRADIVRGERLVRVRERRGQRIWKQSLEQTERFVKRALPHYLRMLDEGDPFRWWGILHGNTHDEVCQWHERIAKIYPFVGPGEGWAVRAEPHVTIATVARSLYSLQQLGITRAHFLAATNNQITATLMALGPKANLEFLSYDSSYSVKSSMHRIVFQRNDKDWSWTPVKEMLARHWNSSQFNTREEFYASQASNTMARDILRVCECEVCVYMRDRHKDHPEYIENRFGGVYSLWGSLHNQAVQQVVTSAQHAAAEAGQGDEMLRAVLGPADYFKAMRSFDGREAQTSTGTEARLLDFLK